MSWSDNEDGWCEVWVGLGVVVVWGIIDQVSFTEETGGITTPVVTIEVTTLPVSTDQLSIFDQVSTTTEGKGSCSTTTGAGSSLANQDWIRDTKAWAPIGSIMR